MLATVRRGEKAAMARSKACRTRWHWVIVVAAFTQYFLALGPQFNYSILYVSLQEEFKTDAAITGWLGSLANALACLFSPLTVLLEQKLSKRSVVLTGLVLFCAGLLLTSFVPALGYAYLTYGVLTGIGGNFMVHSSLTLLFDWFVKRDIARSSAIAMIGAPCGMLAFSPLLTGVITRCGWRNALRILSGGILAVGVVDALLLSNPQAEEYNTVQNGSENASADQEREMKEITEKEDVDIRRGKETDVVEVAETETDKMDVNEKDFCVVSPHESQVKGIGLFGMFRSLEVLMWSLGNMLSFVGWTFFNINFASYMDGLGLHSDQISNAIIAFAGGEIGGKILIALTGNRLPFKYLYLLAATCLLAAVPLGLMTIVTTYATVMPIAIVSGVLRSGVYGGLYPADAELFLEMYGTDGVMVLSMVPTGIGILVSAPLSGKLYDATGDYVVSLLVIAAIFVCASVAFLFIPAWRRFRSRGACCSSAAHTP